MAAIKSANLEKFPGAAYLRYVDMESFNRTPLRNRIRFEDMVLQRCLFCIPGLATLEDPINPGQLVAARHHAWISVDTDNFINYNCSCNFANHDDASVTRRGIAVGVAKLAKPHALTNDYSLPVPTSFPGFEQTLDWIVDRGNSGIAVYLTHVFRQQLKYCSSDKRWYYWDGVLWNCDEEEKFLGQYIVRNVANLLEDYIEGLDGDDKVRKRAATALRKAYCSGGAIESTLRLMKYALEDKNFNEKRLHRGYIATKNMIVDLQTGRGRDYRHSDYITSKCAFAYDACDCASTQQCFSSGNAPNACNCQCSIDMLWVNERIKEICGVELKHVVWIQAGTGEKMPAPRSSKLSQAKEYWLDGNGEEHARRPEKIRAARIERVEELAFEDGGMANYWRFVWTVGYMLSGYADRKLFILGYGDQNNGKSLIWNAIMRVFKIYMTPMHPSMIYGKSRTDDGPTPGTIHVVNKRGAVVVETQENAKLNDEAVKMWAGGDPIVGRKMRGEMEDFKPNLVAMSNTNVPPRWNILDNAILDRIWMLLYPMTYVRPEYRSAYPLDYALHERPRDDTHSRQFESEKYSHALGNWGIRACRFYLNNKETCPMPQKVKEIVERFQNANNPIPQYLNASGTYSFDAESSVPFAEFFTNMKAYCKENSIVCRFTQKSEFKKLVQRLDSNDCEHRLSLIDEGSAGERIRGIRHNIALNNNQYNDHQ